MLQKSKSLLFFPSILLIPLFLNISCMQRNSKWTAQAPAQVDQLGVLINGGANLKKSDIENLLQNYKNSQARVLNESHGFYEIKGIKQEDLKQLFPNAQLEQNKILPNLLNNDVTAQLNQKMMIKRYQDIPELADCDWNATEDKTPTVNVEARFADKQIEQGALIPENQGEIAFSGEKSRIASGVTGEMKLVWYIDAPDSESKWSGHYEVANTKSFIPDLFGTYHVVLIAKQISNKACLPYEFVFYVTRSKPEAYKGPTQRRPWTETSSTTFDYLPAIDAISARTFSEGNGVTIAILDTGVAYNHIDLAPNIWTNPHPTAVNDLIGWNFVNGINMPFDDDGHGTHVAGLAAGAVGGVAPKAKIMAVKVIDAAGSSDTGTISAGILFAVDHGAQIINLSLGGKGNPPWSIFRAIDYAESKGVLVVTAAGNDTADIDLEPVYPACFPQDNLITVAATGMTGTLTEYSNFGKNSVTLGAPGGYPNAKLMGPSPYGKTLDRYVGKSGTSMASPIVAGVAALVKSANPNITPENLKTLLMNNGVSTYSLRSRTKSGTFINAMKAVQTARLH